jgi:polysaccharide biosynthesis/export protein
MVYKNLSLLLTIIVCSTFASAQSPATSTALEQKAPVGLEQPANTTAKISTTAYRIGAGDLLEIKVFGVDLLNRQVRVDSRGLISLPHLNEPINVQCLTEPELAQLLETKYAKLIRAPHVDVSIKEYQSQPVAVIGAVKQAGRFQLQRRVRLLELLTYAGGPSDGAGTTINVLHDEEMTSCSYDPSPRPLFQTVTLKALLEGRPEANFYVQPGDIITIPNADLIFVAGNVAKPGPQPITERMTITKAIALAGGIKPDTAKDKIRIIRQNPGTADTEIAVDLTAIEKKKADDVVLHTNDVIMVPDSNSTAKNVLRTMLGTIGVGLGNAPFTVIR